MHSRSSKTLRELKRYRAWLARVSGLHAELCLAIVLVVADWMFVLPASVRMVGLLAMAAVLIIAFFLRPGTRYNRNEAAAEVEAHYTERGQRLRTGRRLCRA